jgi:hypothetical protein
MLIHPYLRTELGRLHAAERLPGAASDRRVAAGCRAIDWFADRLGRIRAAGPRMRAGSPEGPVRIRLATESDRETWPELAGEWPDRVLVADVDGKPRAALSLVDGTVLAAAERKPGSAR